MSIAPVAGRLLDLARAAGYTPTGFAKQLGVPPATVQKWTSGSEPSTALLARAAAFLGVSGHYLLTGALPIEPPGVPVSAERAYQAGFLAGERRSVEAARAILKRLGLPAPEMDLDTLEDENPLLRALTPGAAPARATGEQGQQSKSGKQQPPTPEEIRHTEEAVQAQQQALAAAARAKGAGKRQGGPGDRPA